MFAVITWRPGIGDPTWTGWVTVAAYLISVYFLCAGRFADAAKSRRISNESPMMWFVFAIGLLLLGVNKQLDLQTAFIELGGQVAHGEGWYQQRRLAQIIFVLVLGAALAGILFIGFYQTTRRFFQKSCVHSFW